MVQIQVDVVRKGTAFTQPERLWKTNCTYEALAPATAMLKPFCFGNLSLEKPFKDGLNFFKMSEEKKDAERFIDEHA